MLDGQIEHLHSRSFQSIAAAKLYGSHIGKYSTLLKVCLTFPQIPQELRPAIGGGFDSEPGPAQLPLFPSPASLQTCASVLRSLWFSVLVHLHGLWYQILHHSLSGNPFGNQMSQMDSVIFVRKYQNLHVVIQNFVLKKINAFEKC